MSLIVDKYKDLSEEFIYGKNGLVSRLIPLQRAYNAIKNRELEYINRISMGVLCVEDGSADIDELREDGVSGGKVIVYRQGANPPVQTHIEDVSIAKARANQDFCVATSKSKR